MTALSSRAMKPAAAAPAEPWLVRHRQQVLLALAAAVVAVLLTAFVVSKLKQAEERDWEQLSTALSQASQGRTADALRSLDTLLSSQRSEPLSVQGLLMKSDLLIGEGKKADALAASREAVRQAASSQYKSIAAVSLAYALEQAGKPDEAAAEYARFIKDFPDHFLAGRAYAQMGRLQAAQGKWAEAKGTLEKLITMYPSTVWARDAKATLEEAARRSAPK